MAEEIQRIERCFWCGRPKDASITQETEETIKNSVINNYVPCDACKESFGNGIHVIGVSKDPIVQGMFPISKDDKTVLYPTGSMFVANDDFIKDMLDGEKELLNNVLKERILLLPTESVEEIVELARKEQEGKDNDDYIKENLDQTEN